MLAPPSRPFAQVRGVVRLLNTAGGRVLCLAGEVDDDAVAAFLHRYGGEPVRVDAVDAGSVTGLSSAGRQLLVDHLDAAAARTGRPLPVRRSPELARALAEDGTRRATRPG
ncbi:hypothetical protein [Blastococcus sp. VKM Ac-2987]|uniref:hypothetical protein n=1 Tax=Blastococcus sp. VKM Ac-2987 TaxID=3004141 RepID=UPI0022AB74F5|nr:hypothetical protein [Blastococcus sp. VKM Ac-2987]MCZ2860515.1 hypothetical protein [Blastococcus sp. VKM Ac-2987]